LQSGSQLRVAGRDRHHAMRAAPAATSELPAVRFALQSNLGALYFERRALKRTELIEVLVCVVLNPYVSRLGENRRSRLADIATTRSSELRRM
jgi:hypothetical protein